MSEIGPGPEGQSTGENQKEPAPATPPGGDERETNMWAMFIHFSILCGWAVPLAGLIVPILLWQIKKDDLPGIVPHAHVVLNWIVTSLVYGLICFILTFVFIGILGFIALGIATIIFAVIGGVKANNGELWEYPGTIVKVFK
ncbi:MAG: DUF4870 domain-containing protein [Xanthomonadales bacterium]|jgi:uncharacterized Tic20 family protein|nr:DUF4870 domain-containing protein [Xanthomonadales bacterium]